MSLDLFDKDYFQNGMATGKSCYENYRWIPELSYPMAFSLHKYLNFREDETIVDYGCAYGFLVKALRDFGFRAHGVDISQHAVDFCPPDVKEVIRVIDRPIREVLLGLDIKVVDWLISKDVFEHIDRAALEGLLCQLSPFVKKMLVIVPLGDNGVYRIPAYHLDPTHVIAEDEDFWEDTFSRNGFRVLDRKHEIRGVKDRWTKLHAKGNGVFVLESSV